MNLPRAKRFLISTITYAIILLTTLVVIDGICIALNLFPPTHNFGDPELGWRAAGATGRMEVGRCTEFSTGEVIDYSRNEDGIRTELTREEITSDTTSIRIAVTGDSQTDLCAPNSEIHAGFLEADLRAIGIQATALPYGAGKYSPLQGYLAIKKMLSPLHPQVLVLNVYTGNDFYDMLRVDDRPHFSVTDTGYRIAEPVWFLLDNPNVQRKSRVLFAARLLSDKTGVRRLYHRVLELRRLGAQHGAGWWEVMAYMRDLWKAREPSVGYSDAFTAQMLNQQLFFQRFPSGLDESLDRMKALMLLIRQENPGLILLMSPLPSYQLVGEQPVDEALLRTLERLPITYQEGVQQERMLYTHLGRLSAEAEWLFVDNLTALQAYRGDKRLYNDFDYHLLPIASSLIGRAQAAVLSDRLLHDRGNPRHLENRSSDIRRTFR